MDDTENSKPTDEASSEKNEPKRGNVRLTVEQSAELLQRISNFSTKKDDVLSKLSDISQKMQSRLQELEAKYPGSVPHVNNPQANNPNADKQTQPSSALADMAAHILHDHQVSQGFENRLFHLDNVKFTRVREVDPPKPNGEALTIKFPNATAIDELWVSASCAKLEVVEDGVILPPNTKAYLNMGIRLSIPKDCALVVENGVIPGLNIVNPHTITASQTGELVLLVENFFDTPIKLTHGSLIACLVPVVSPKIGKVEELLNGTFESWISGEIH